MIRSYEELNVYQLSFEAAMKIFEVTKGFPKNEPTHLQIKYVGRQDRFVQTLRKLGEKEDMKRDSFIG